MRSLYSFLVSLLNRRIDDVAAAEAYIAELGWKVDSAAGVIEVTATHDNTVASTVVQENIKLPRTFPNLLLQSQTEN